jgi:hypothetical protein
MVQVGYGSPKEVRGLNKDGFLEIIVSNIQDLKSVGKGQIALIARTVGAKKRLSILEEAKKSKIAIANIKDIDAKIKELTKTPKEEKKEKYKRRKSSRKSRKWRVKKIKRMPFLKRNRKLQKRKKLQTPIPSLQTLRKEV